MFKSLSDKRKKIFMESLILKYDEINSKLHSEFLKMYYDEDDIEEMKKRLERLDEMIRELKED
jgi:hypothetical protein